MLPPHRYKTLVLAACLSMLSLSAAAVQIDLLILYDNGVVREENGVPHTLARSLVNQSNIIYENSGVDIQLRLVGLEAFDENFASLTAGEILEVVTNSSLAASLREQVGADLVAQLSSLDGDASRTCGIAWLADGDRNDATYAYSVTGSYCGVTTFIHEIGHNMGLNHSRRQGDTGGGVYNHGLGYGVDGSFSTLMAYSSSFNANKVSRFSDPTASCRGLPCGKPESSTESAYAVKALNSYRSIATKFRDEVPVIIDNGSSSSSSSTSSSSSSGTSDNGPSTGSTSSGGVNGNDITDNPIISKSGGTTTLWLILNLFAIAFFRRR